MSKYDDLLDKLIEYSNADYVPMHMPGAKRNTLLYDERKSNNISNINEAAGVLSRLDITEIEGFDNLHNPEGILLEMQKKAERLYNSEKSLVSVNGSTAGILAAISGVCNKGDHILVARNCHVSVYNAVFLNELYPHYIVPEVDKKNGIAKGITLDDIKKTIRKMLEENNIIFKYKDEGKVLNNNKIVGDYYLTNQKSNTEIYRTIDMTQIKAVIITSPTYEGLVSDVKEIADFLHEFKIPLIVDEAHGAHFQFNDAFPKSSIKLGADVVINSIHKTLPAPTQTALLHLNSNLINYDRVKRYLDIYETTSPSYLLMAGVDRALSFVEKDGKKAYERYILMLKELRTKISKLKYIKLEDVDDISKIVLSGPDFIGNFGKKLYDVLLNKYRVQLEMASFSYAIAMTSVCDKKEYYDIFFRGLEEIDRQIQNIKDTYDIKTKEIQDGQIIDMQEKQIKNIRDIQSNNIEKNGIEFGNMCSGIIMLERPSDVEKRIQHSGYQEISIFDDKICGMECVNPVLLYPPGMPLINSGELIQQDKVEIIRMARKSGIEILGLNKDLIKVTNKVK